MPNQGAAQGIIPGYDQRAFAIAMLQLCQISYMKTPTRMRINNAVRAMPKFDPGGQWACPWGPVLAGDGANLAFVATYTPGIASEKIFGAVVIRGTTLNWDDPVNSLIQLWEDFACLDPQQLPGAPSGTYISGGTLDGLSYVQNMQWGKQFLPDWMNGFFSGAGAGGFLAVTGHSLGACLATVVAPWLLNAQTTAAPVFPVSFAGPTAGCTAFASYFDSTFKSLLYRNPLDIAPSAFGNLDALYDIYDTSDSPPLNIELPLELVPLIVCAQGGLDTLYELENITYAQPTGSAPALSTITLWTTSWIDQARFQHHPSTYMQLLNGINVAPMLASERAAYRSPRMRERIAAVRAGMRARSVAASG